MTTVNVDSVDFAPYITLLPGKIDGHRLLDHLVVITDGDPELPPGPEERTVTRTTKFFRREKEKPNPTRRPRKAMVRKPLKKQSRKQPTDAAACSH